VKLKDALIAWDCDSDRVKVGPVDGYPFGWSEGYEMTGGGCYSNVQNLKGLEARHRVMSDFIGLVVRDGVDAQAAHREFLKIDEYRRAIPVDMRGAETTP
jgi:hypothetical protein